MAGTGSDGILAVEVLELPSTATTHQLEPVRPAEPFAGLPDQSPVPLADALGRGLHRAGDAAEGARSAVGRGLLTLISWVLAFVPHRRPEYPRSIPRTAEREQGRRRRIGLAGMVVVAAILAVGSTVAALPTARPTDAIPRATIARVSISEAVELVGAVEERIDGADLVDRDPERAVELLAAARAAVGRASGVGVADAELAPLLRRIDRRLDALYQVDRVAVGAPVVDLAASLEDVDATDMVAASDGSLWILDSGRGRIVRADPADGSAQVLYRAGQALQTGETPGDPWLIATAATDVVVIDRQRSAWRIDLAERIARRMPLAGAELLSPETTLCRRHPASATARDLQPLHRRRRHRHHPPMDAPGGHPGHVSGPGRAVPDRGARPRSARGPRPARRRQRLAAARRHRHAHRLRLAARPGRLLARRPARRRPAAAARLPAPRRRHGR